MWFFFTLIYRRRETIVDISFRCTSVLRAGTLYATSNRYLRCGISQHEIFGMHQKAVDCVATEARLVVVKFGKCENYREFPDLSAEKAILNKSSDLQRKEALVTRIEVTPVPWRGELLVEADVAWNAVFLRCSKGSLQEEEVVKPVQLFLREILELVEGFRLDADNVSTWIGVRMTREPRLCFCNRKQEYVSDAGIWSSAYGALQRWRRGAGAEVAVVA